MNENLNVRQPYSAPAEPKRLASMEEVENGPYNAFDGGLIPNAYSSV